MKKFNLPLFEIVGVLIPVNHVARFIENANHSMMGTTETAGASSASG